ARTVKGALQPLPVVVVATAEEPPGVTEEGSGVDSDTELDSDSDESIEGGDV
ncbi:uncharacterized protein METZ01_LOCUS347098, partial [marine metagenome]